MFRKVLVIVFALEALVNVLMIGKELHPVTPNMCAFTLVADGILIYGVFKWL